jgi:UDP-2-acetamido-3-amino-2,3-dideoxy-glucuronate N-acetyltransferase
MTTTSHMSETQVRICVVGCGHWGKNLLRNFHDLGYLHGLYDASPERLASFAAKYPTARAYESYDELLSDSTVDAVVLATPAEEHASMAVASLNSGKDVFVEKPMALTPEGGEEIVAAARQTGRLLMVGHLLLYHPAVVEVERLLVAGELGRLEYIYSNRLSMGKIRTEENALWSFAPHDISVILRLTNQMPVQVSATGGTYLQPNVADVTVSDLLFDRGVRAHVFVSWLHPYKEQRLVVIGSRKTVVFEETRPGGHLLLYDNRIARNGNGFEVTQSQPIELAYGSEEPLRAECRHFANCIETRQQPRTPAEDGLRVLQVLQSCQRSLQLNGELVELNARAFQRVAAM